MVILQQFLVRAKPCYAYRYKTVRYCFAQEQGNMPSSRLLGTFLAIWLKLGKDAFLRTYGRRVRTINPC
jgi:hypothetical protein